MCHRFETTNGRESRTPNRTRGIAVTEPNTTPTTKTTEPVVVSRPAGTVEDELRWLPCSGCSGEVGVPPDWGEAAVRCPKCGASVEVRQPQAGVVWRPGAGASQTSSNSADPPAAEAVESSEAYAAGHAAAAAGTPPATVPHRAKTPARTSAAANQTVNAAAITGLCLGIASVFLYVVGLLPILAVVFSGIGLAKAQSRNGQGQVAAWIGLVLGVLYTIMYLAHYGHLPLSVPSPRPQTGGQAATQQPSASIPTVPSRATAVAYLDLGDEYWGKNDMDRAIASYTAAIRLDPRYIQAYKSRGACYQEKGDKLAADADSAEAERLERRLWIR